MPDKGCVLKCSGCDDEKTYRKTGSTISDFVLQYIQVLSDRAIHEHKRARMIAVNSAVSLCVFFAAAIKQSRGEINVYELRRWIDILEQMTNLWQILFISKMT